MTPTTSMPRARRKEHRARVLIVTMVTIGITSLMSAFSLSSGRSMRLEDWLISVLLSPSNNSPWYLFSVAAFTCFGMVIPYILALPDLAKNQSLLARLGSRIAPVTAFIVAAFAISTPLPAFSDIHQYLAYLVYAALLTTVGLILLGLSKNRSGRCFWTGLLQFCGLAVMAIFYLVSLRVETNYSLLAVFEWCLIFCNMWGLWVIVSHSGEPHPSYPQVE